MERKYIHMKIFDDRFLQSNIHQIDKVDIDDSCFPTHPCQHHLSVHMKSSPPEEWIKFEEFVSAEKLLYIYDLLNDKDKEHFSYLVTQSWKFGIHLHLLLDRIYQKHKDQIEQKNNVIDMLRNEIKEKNIEIVQLKYKGPNGQHRSNH